MSKIGVMLVNIGTPRSPETKDVAKYLREFLMDPLVIDLPFVLRWPLVNLLIVPFRAPKSAEKYKKVWTERGSPLSFHSADLAKRLGDKLPFPVEMAMHFGEPQLRQVLKKIKAQNVDKLIVVPLFPQYANATTGATIMAVTALAKAEKINAKIEFLPAFYQDENFLFSWTSLFEKQFPTQKPDHTLFTFHGLPLSQIKKVCGSCDPNNNCCAFQTEKNKDCYRMQCFETARLLAKKLELAEGAWSVSFQSRLGRAEWIRPYTEDVLVNLAKQGVKRLAVLCPAFTTDCLETIEEIGIEGRHTFQSSSGGEYILLPCLNSEDVWVNALAKLVQGMTK